MSLVAWGGGDEGGVREQRWRGSPPSIRGLTAACKEEWRRALRAVIGGPLVVSLLCPG